MNISWNYAAGALFEKYDFEQEKTPPYGRYVAGSSNSAVYVAKVLDPISILLRDSDETTSTTTPNSTSSSSSSTNTSSTLSFVQNNISNALPPSTPANYASSVVIPSSTAISSALFGEHKRIQYVAIKEVACAVRITKVETATLLAEAELNTFNTLGTHRHLMRLIDAYAYEPEDEYTNTTKKKNTTSTNNNILNGYRYYHQQYRNNTNALISNNHRTPHDFIQRFEQISNNDDTNLPMHDMLYNDPELNRRYLDLLPLSGPCYRFVLPLAKGDLSKWMQTICINANIYNSDSDIHGIMDDGDEGIEQSIPRSIQKVQEQKKMIIFSEPLAADILYQVALAVNYTHKKGMVNRDLKLANIMIFREPGGLEYPKITVPLFDVGSVSGLHADVICLGYNGDFRRTRAVQLRLNKKKQSRLSVGINNDGAVDQPERDPEEEGMESADFVEENVSLASKIDENRVSNIEQRIPYIIIGDFGSAHREESGTQSFYTEENCPPEQKGGPDPIVGPKYDAWLLGMVLAVLLMGENVYATGRWREMTRSRPSYGSLDIPDSFGLSDNVKDVLKGLLNPTIKDRLSIEQLIDHPWMQPAVARYCQAESIGVFENEEPDDDTIDFYLDKQRMLAKRREEDKNWQKRDSEKAQRYDTKILQESISKNGGQNVRSIETSPSLSGLPISLPPRNPNIMDLTLPPATAASNHTLPHSLPSTSTSSSRNHSGITLGGSYDIPMTPQLHGIMLANFNRDVPRVVHGHLEIAERLKYILGSHYHVKKDDHDTLERSYTLSHAAHSTSTATSNVGGDDDDDYLDTAMNANEMEEETGPDKEENRTLSFSVYGTRYDTVNQGGSNAGMNPNDKGFQSHIYNGDISNMKGTLDQASGRISELIMQLDMEDKQNNTDRNKQTISNLRTRVESAISRVLQRIIYQMDGKASHQIMLLVNHLKAVVKAIQDTVPGDSILASIAQRLKMYADHWIQVALVDALGRLIVQLNGIGTGGTLHIKLAYGNALRAFINNISLFCEVRNGIEDGKAYRAVRKSLLDALGAVLDGLIRPRTVYTETRKQQPSGSPVLYATSPTLGAFISQAGAMATVSAASAADASLLFANDSVFAKEILDLAFYALCRIIRNNFCCDTKTRVTNGMVNFSLNVYSRDTLSRCLVLLTNIVTSPIFDWGSTMDQIFCKLSALLPLTPPFTVAGKVSNDNHSSWGILPWGLLWAMTSDRFMLGEDTNWQEFDRITPNIAILIQRALSGSLLLHSDTARLEAPTACEWLPQAILQVEAAAVRLLKGGRTAHLVPIVELLLELSRPEHGSMKAEGHKRLKSYCPVPLSGNNSPQKIRSPEKISRFRPPGYISPVTVHQSSNDRTGISDGSENFSIHRTLPSPLSTHATVLVAQMLSALTSLTNMHALKQREMADTAKIRQACRICALLLALLRPLSDKVPKDPAIRNACLAQVRTGNILLLRTVQLTTLIASDAFLLPDEAVEPVVRLLRLCALPASGSRNGEDDPDWEPDSLRRLGRGFSVVPAIRSLLVRYSTSPSVVIACLDLLDDMLDFDLNPFCNGTAFQRFEPTNSNWGNNSQAILSNLMNRQQDSDSTNGLNIQPPTVTDSMLIGVELLGLNAATREALSAAVKGAMEGSRANTPVARRVDARLQSVGTTNSTYVSGTVTTKSSSNAPHYTVSYNEHWEVPEVSSSIPSSTNLLSTASNSSIVGHHPIASYNNYRLHREEILSREIFRRRVFQKQEEPNVRLLHQALKADRRRAMNEKRDVNDTDTKLPPQEDGYANIPELASSMLTFIPALCGVLFDLFEAAKQKKNSSRVESEFRLPVSDTAVIRRVLHSLTQLCCFPDAAGLVHRSDGGYRRPATINILSEMLTYIRMFDQPLSESTDDISKYDLGAIDGRREPTASVSIAILRLIRFMVQHLGGKIRFVDNPNAATNACIDEIFRFRRKYCESFTVPSPLKPRISKLAELRERNQSPNQASVKIQLSNSKENLSETSSLLLSTDSNQNVPRQPLPTEEEVDACTECFEILISLAEYHNERKEKFVEENFRRQIQQNHAVPRTQTCESDDGYYYNPDDYDASGLHHSASNSSSVMDPSNYMQRVTSYPGGWNNNRDNTIGRNGIGLLQGEDDGPTNPLYSVSNVNQSVFGTGGGWTSSILRSVEPTPETVTAPNERQYNPATLPNTVLHTLVKDMQPVIFEMVHLLNCNLPEPYGEIIRGSSRKFLHDVINLDKINEQSSGILSVLLHDNYSTISELIRGLERSASSLENAYRKSTNSSNFVPNLQNHGDRSIVSVDNTTGASMHVVDKQYNSNTVESPGFSVTSSSTNNEPNNNATDNRNSIGTIRHLRAILALIPESLPQKAREFVRELGISPLARIIACPLSESLGITNIIVDISVRILNLVDDDELYKNKVTEQWTTVRDAKVLFTKQITLQVHLEKEIINEFLRSWGNTVNPTESIHLSCSRENISALVKAGIVDPICLKDTISDEEIGNYNEDNIIGIGIDTENNLTNNNSNIRNAIEEIDNGELLIHRQITLNLPSPTGSSLNLHATEFVPSVPLPTKTVVEPPIVPENPPEIPVSSSSTSSSTAPPTVRPTTSSKFTFMKRGEKKVTTSK